MSITARPSISRAVAVATLGVLAAVTGTALYGLGSERWVSTGYSTAGQTFVSQTSIDRSSIDRAADMAADRSRAGLKPVLATEAEWLAARTTSTVLRAVGGGSVAGAARIDFGPLDVIDVRPLPAGLDIGAAGAPKLLVSARETNSGRTVQFIVDAGSTFMSPRVGKQDGL